MLRDCSVSLKNKDSSSHVYEVGVESAKAQYLQIKSRLSHSRHLFNKTHVSKRLTHYCLEDLYATRRLAGLPTCKNYFLKMKCHRCSQRNMTHLESFS